LVIAHSGLDGKENGLMVRFVSVTGWNEGIVHTTWRFSLDEHGRSSQCLEHVGKIGDRFRDGGLQLAADVGEILCERY
jgi:hypothetical protein